MKMKIMMIIGLLWFIGGCNYDAERWRQASQTLNQAANDQAARESAYNRDAQQQNEKMQNDERNHKLDQFLQDQEQKKYYPGR